MCIIVIVYLFCIYNITELPWSVRPSVSHEIYSIPKMPCENGNVGNNSSDLKAQRKASLQPRGSSSPHIYISLMQAYKELVLMLAPSSP